MLCPGLQRWGSIEGYPLADLGDASIEDRQLKALLWRGAV